MYCPNSRTIVTASLIFFSYIFIFCRTAIINSYKEKKLAKSSDTLRLCSTSFASSSSSSLLRNPRNRAFNSEILICLLDVQNDKTFSLYGIRIS